MSGARTLAWLVPLALALSTLGCGAGEAVTEHPRPSPASVGDAAPRAQTSDAIAPAVAPPPSSAPPALATPPAPKSDPRVDIGTIHALGDHFDAPADWSHPSVGPSVGDPPADATHALPRVVIDVTKSSGSLKASAIESHARSEFWGRVIECYRPGAVRDQTLRGETTLRVTVARGEVRQAKVVSPMRDKSVSACLAKRLVGIKMPEGRKGSTATLKIHVAPGDEPMAPADEDVTRGPGQLDVDELRAGIESALPRLLACYREALAFTPELTGWLSVRVAIAKDGALAEAFESGTHFPDEHLARCTLRAIRNVKIAPPQGGSVRAFVPLRFDPHDAANEGSAAGPSK